MDDVREELPAGPVALHRWRDGDAAELFRVATESLPHRAEGSAHNFAIRLPDALPDGALVGSCAMPARIGPGGREIGYWLHPGHTGKGYATAAVAALTNEGFRAGAARVEIVHDVANTRSGAIPRRLGFTEVTRRPPQEPATPGEAGADVAWRLLAP